MDTDRPASAGSPADPDPARTPGLEPGGGVRPGDTPPGEGSVSGVAHNEVMPPPRAVPRAALVAIGIVVALFAVMILAMIVTVLR